MVSLPSTIRGSAVYRHGDRATQMVDNGRLDNSLVCECEAVTAGEVRYAVEIING
ncbi:Anaerobic glycerol-3-phosphate dehydrogenase subunit A [Budvicia aquatica]|uniref:Anaerobic glycerol-3-phosphate dehydrogenase subunit A n=1 Tax=Budvicia aquatica TaxID=82979 RepID=A0A484ZBG4_9GAMM|nr:Anaerobic glycerol-3-phosphate dehydrogenase subunit A [Budvicia aquatica]